MSLLIVVCTIKHRTTLYGTNKISYYQNCANVESCYDLILSFILIIIDNVEFKGDGTCKEMVY